VRFSLRGFRVQLAFGFRAAPREATRFLLAGAVMPLPGPVGSFAAKLLVLFDEPTAALDAPTEHALFERFAAAARNGQSAGTVTVLVSHRFSTVRMADRIVVLAGGRIIEQGSHQ